MIDELERAGVERRRLEGSVRRDAGGQLRADRMMIEKASEVAVRLIAGHLGVRGEALEPIAAAAREAGVPLIAGWDLGARAAKLYANASDASEGVRERLAARLGAPRAAHVIGVNARPDGVDEIKYYCQSRDAMLLARELDDEAALELAERCAQIAAGGVASFDLAADRSSAPRAFFVALRPAEPEVLDAALGFLPGFAMASVRAVLPFAPAPPRSIGVAHRRPERWTLYLKPQGAAGLHVIEPFASFRAPGCEVGLYEAAPGERAYAIAGGRPIAYRVREGSPSSLRLLLDWAVAALDRGASLDAPPVPWERVP